MTTLFAMFSTFHILNHNNLCSLFAVHIPILCSMLLFFISRAHSCIFKWNLKLLAMRRNLCLIDSYVPWHANMSSMNYCILYYHWLNWSDSRLKMLQVPFNIILLLSKHRPQTFSMVFINQQIFEHFHCSDT